MKENSPVHQLGNFVDRHWGVSEIGGTVTAPPTGDRAGVANSALVFRGG